LTLCTLMSYDLDVCSRNTVYFSFTIIYMKNRLHQRPLVCRLAGHSYGLRRVER